MTQAGYNRGRSIFQSNLAERGDTPFDARFSDQYIDGTVGHHHLHAGERCIDTDDSVFNGEIYDTTTVLDSDDPVFVGDIAVRNIPQFSLDAGRADDSSGRGGNHNAFNDQCHF